jgi:zinc D-Ala-D-Ala dipeptidase
MMQKFILILILSGLYSCSEGEVKENKIELAKSVELITETAETSHLEVATIKQNDSLLRMLDLTDVQSLNPLIYVDLKYASTDNFMRTKVYERLTRAYLKTDVAEKLARCQAYLTAIDTSLHLLVYDAVRPVSVQWKMWKALDSIPSVERGKYVSNPRNKSVHNYGAAVDLTICNSQGEPLDMGAGFDEFSAIAYPSKEAYFLKEGKLTQEQVNNRILLRKVMRQERFRNLPTEWWHFNACSRIEAAQKYSVVEEEP